MADKLLMTKGFQSMAAEKLQKTGFNPLPASGDDSLLVILCKENQLEPKATVPFFRPRPQSVMTWGSWAFILLLFVLLMPSLFLFVKTDISAMVKEWQAYRVLKESGIPLEAVIINPRTGESANGESSSYYVTYQYTAPLPQGGQQRFTQNEKTNQKRYVAMPPETRVTILYDPANPRTARLQDGGHPLLPLMLFPKFFLVWLPLLFIDSSIRLIRLRIYGQITSGIVVDRWVESGSEGEAHCIAYRFQALQPNGLSQPVTQADDNLTAYHKFKVGDTIQIRYLPHKPEVCQVKV